MSEEELRIKVHDLENQVAVLKDQIGNLQDIEEIKTLQKAYGYYLEHWMTEEVVDLFSDGPDVSLTLAAGTYLGKKGVRGYFEQLDGSDPEFLHQVMQLSGIVTVNPDGKTAKGRWYGWGVMAIPGKNGVRQTFMSGIYGGDYVKEDGVWKIQKLRFDMKTTATPARGWVKPDRLAPAELQRDVPVFKADIPRPFNTRYPSGYVYPFHYKHPVTGKKSTEDIRNSKVIDKQKGK